MSNKTISTSSSEILLIPSSKLANVVTSLITLCVSNNSFISLLKTVNCSMTTTFSCFILTSINQPF